MATPFSSIYSSFVFKLRDYSFLDIPQEDLDDIFFNYLRSAIVRFPNCKQDLFDLDTTLKIFNQDLTMTEQEILAFLMCVEYLIPQILRIENLKHTMSTRDYQLTSQAQHLKELVGLRKYLMSEANQLIMNYSIKNGKLGDLK
jgi:hypothetical protein